MPRTGIVLRRTVVDSSEIIILVLHGMRRDRVRDLCRCVEIQARIVGNHASEERQIYRRERLECRLAGRFVELTVLRLQRDLRQRLDLTGADEKQRTRFLMVPIGTFSEPGEFSGTEADGGSRPPLCFHASNRMIASFSVISLVMHGAWSPSRMGMSSAPMSRYTIRTL